MIATLCAGALYSVGLTPFVATFLLPLVAGAIGAIVLAIVWIGRVRLSVVPMFVFQNGVSFKAVTDAELRGGGW